MPFCEYLKHKTTSSDSTFTPFGSFHTEFSLDGVHYRVCMEISCGYFIMQTFYHCSWVKMWWWKCSRFFSALAFLCRQTLMLCVENVSPHKLLHNHLFTFSSFSTLTLLPPMPWNCCVCIYMWMSPPLSNSTVYCSLLALLL